MWYNNTTGSSGKKLLTSIQELPVSNFCQMICDFLPQFHRKQGHSPFLEILPNYSFTDTGPCRYRSSTCSTDVHFLSSLRPQNTGPKVNDFVDSKCGKLSSAIL